MFNRFSRTELLLGTSNMHKLYGAKVAVFGIGGVGGHAAEALARSGIGCLDLFDHDKVCESNINRQIYATYKTIGLFKVDVAYKRIREINPDATVGAHKMFYLPQTASQVDLRQYDYVIDAIDTVSGKLELATRCHADGVPLISAMGAGNKRDASLFMVSDIYETSVCPLARVMRRECRKRGLPHLKVVYSRETPFVHICKNPERLGVKRPPGSTAFVPAVAGLIIAGEVVNDLTGL
ncbi:MAG: tRNA threonylcarbamoyladenosine dehydratase [Oscillospiraceae bacterium]|nr:tRNA threonylcarbamoyladenosine dehydratase [Oscillospiraceae bacterium]